MFRVYSCAFAVTDFQSCVCHHMSRAIPQVEVNTMVLEAVVKDDGTLIAKAPDSLRGKRVKIIVRQPEHQPPPGETVAVG